MLEGLEFAKGCFGMISFYEFSRAIHDRTGKEVKMLPKSDLHNHAGRGGSISYLKEQFKIDIKPFEGVFCDIESMDLWFKHNIQSKLPRGVDNYLKRVEANFNAAKEDNIVSLALDFGIGEIYRMGGMESFIDIINNMRKMYAPNTRLIPVLVIREIRDLEYLEDVFSHNWFKAIDIINYKNEISIDLLKIVCDFARNNDLKCKAHVGEFGTADDVWEYVTNLQLDEVQHGVKIVENPSILEKVSNLNVVFNVCPASNIALGICKDYKTHPIKEMIDHGLIVTINTDDQLIFNASVTDEYINLFHSGALNEEELYQIYKNGISLYENL